MFAIYMMQFDVKIRVRYAETDQMGFVYYGNYATYLEVARVETIRSIGINYKSMEEEGIALPIYEYNIKYYKPALYDQELTIQTSIPSLPTSRILFEYKIFNEKKELLSVASTTLVFMDLRTKKACAPPESLLFKLKKYYN